MRLHKIANAKQKIASGEYDYQWIDDLVSHRALAEARRTPHDPCEQSGEYPIVHGGAGTIYTAFVVATAMLLVAFVGFMAWVL